MVKCLLSMGGALHCLVSPEKGEGRSRSWGGGGRDKATPNKRPLSTKNTLRKISLS